jgi:hypothetical protein
MITSAPPAPIFRKPRAHAAMAALAALALCAASPSSALVGDWSSFTHLQVIRDLESSRGDLFAATTGGVIRVAPSGAQKVYRNTEGLRDVGIAALAPGKEGELYATSELGYLYAYNRGADEWDLLSTSYRGAGWAMNKRALVYREGYLVVGSSKGLSFFNLNKRVADANVTKMAGSSGLSVNSLLFVGDTLFAGTNHGIFSAVLHMDKLLTDPSINVFNPGIWSKVPGSEDVFFLHPGPTDGDTVLLADSLRQVGEIRANYPKEFDPGVYSHGFLYHGAYGIGSEFEGSAASGGEGRVSAFGSIVIEGRSVVDGLRRECLARAGSKWYVGAPYGLFEFNSKNGDVIPISNSENIPVFDVTAIKANRYGIFALATPLVYELKGRTWEPIPGLTVINSAGDVKNRGQHAFDVPAAGEFYMGTWGFGFQTFRNGKLSRFDAENTCMASATDQLPNYPVVWTQGMYKDKGIWLGNFIPGKPYRLGYYDFATESVSCANVGNKDTEPRNLQIVGDSVVAVITERGVEAFKIKDEGGAVSLLPENLLIGLGQAGVQTLTGKMDRRGNFWVTTEASTLLYVPAMAFHRDSVRAFKSLDGFSGTACKNLEIDPQGRLWAGCSEGGLFEITPGRDTLSHAFRHYGLNDGLLSETIFNLEVNPLNGEVWIATEKGMSRYESSSRPDQPDLSAAKVYPNPFLAKHENVVFVNLSPGSAIQVMTQSGSVVYQRKLASGEGDQIRWNGRNLAGARVKEGVYFYVIRSPKETKNGKIIVAR